MCTVTFVPKGNRVLLTSSRDEIHFRLPAFPPTIFQSQSGNLIFPKDSEAGGTWICLHQNGNAVVLLNGGFVKHIPQPPYRQSRGLILLEIADNASPIDAFSKIDLSKIEPFTVIIWDKLRLFECRWDGIRSHKKQLDSSSPQLWCSVTLYDHRIVSQRRNRFEKWLTENPELNLDRIMRFHQVEIDGNQPGYPIINKDGIVSTVSITGIELTSDRGLIQYADMITQQTYFQQIDFSNAIPVRQ